LKEAFRLGLIQDGEAWMLMMAAIDELLRPGTAGADGQGHLDLFVAAAEIDVVSFERHQAELARRAFRR